MAAVGETFARVGVAAIYCVHGTFCGNDLLGLLTEIEPHFPRLTHALRKVSKSAFNAVIGETGNYTPEFAQRMQTALSAGRSAGALPVRLFNWSSQNHHIARADGAVRLIDELARLAEQLEVARLPAPSLSWGGLGRGAESADVSTRVTPPLTPHHQGEGNSRATPRVLLWAHSHGGNVFALLTNLLGADQSTRHEFFHATRTFFRPWWSPRADVPVWERVEQLLADPAHPLRRLQLDVVTYGTPIRYGWDSDGYGKLLHLVNHRPHPRRRHHQVAYPPRPDHVITAAHGDFMQQIGIAGTNFPPLPIAVRTLLADWRLGQLLERNLSGWLRSRLQQQMRVPDEGTTLLVDYDDPYRTPLGHLFGHAPYTRSHWLPLHCELVAEHFYGSIRCAL